VIAGSSTGPWRMEDTAMTISRSILFMNPETGADTNTTESRWHHVKATLAAESMAMCST